MDGMIVSCAVGTKKYLQLYSKGPQVFQVNQHENLTRRKKNTLLFTMLDGGSNFHSFLKRTNIDPPTTVAGESALMKEQGWVAGMSITDYMLPIIYSVFFPK